MTLGQRRRTVWATGVSLVLHVLFLAGMVLGLRVVPPPAGDRPMEVSLIAPPQAKPEPVLSKPTPERANAGAPLRPHPTPAPAVPAQTLALPEAKGPAPTAPAQPQYGPGDGLQPSLSGRLGCDDPLTYHLTPEQRQVCDTHMARLGREAKRLVPDINDKNKAAYDRYVECGETYRHARIPSSDQVEPDAMAGGVPPPTSGIDPHFGMDAGMGPIPAKCVKGLGQILSPQGAR